MTPCDKGERSISQDFAEHENREDTTVLTAARTAGSVAVCKELSEQKPFPQSY